MPRLARSGARPPRVAKHCGQAPGVLHNVIGRGIERRKIVHDNKDRKEFITRMGGIATETETAIYAWVLMNNHALC